MSRTLTTSRPVTERNPSRSKKLVIATALAACASGGIALATASPTTPTPATPNSCITLNGGDYNACNVGNSGRGDLPYAPVTHENSGARALDGGYSCLRDTGGGGGQCNTAE